MRRFVACYQSGQQNGPIASQSDISMRDLASLLPRITLLEAESPDRIVFKIAGQNIIDSLGFNPKGQNFLDFLDPSLRQTSAEGHELMHSHPCGYYMVYENIYASGYRKVMETLTLPIHKSPGSTEKLFTSCHFEYQHSEQPANPGETAMVVNWQTNAFVDIGAGEPEKDLLEPFQKSQSPELIS